MRYIIMGDGEFGLEEDFVELAISGDDKLLTFVVHGREVDEQIPSSPGLIQADFEDEPEEAVTSLEAFQKLVDEHFPSIYSVGGTRLDNDIAGWFQCGLNAADDEDEDDDEDE